MRVNSTADCLQKELLETPERRYTPEVSLLSSDGSGLALGDSIRNTGPGEQHQEGGSVCT